ncbi:MAG TPA: hypothetical protein PKA64_18905 [Myxococcota bacterium]|nr:hypothetical protein [Myxococcota bacterium]
MTEPSDPRSQRRDAARHAGVAVSDITLPPTDPAGREQAAMSRRDAWVRERTDAAVLHGLATSALTLMLLSWMVVRGQVPALDPQSGVLLLVLQIGAWVTGWLSFEATRDIARSSDAMGVVDPLPPRVTFFTVTSGMALLINTAMVMAAVLP